MKAFCCCRYTAEAAEADQDMQKLQAADMTCSLSCIL